MNSLGQKVCHHGSSFNHRRFNTSILSPTQSTHINTITNITSTIHHHSCTPLSPWHAIALWPLWQRCPESRCLWKNPRELHSDLDHSQMGYPTNLRSACSIGCSKAPFRSTWQSKQWLQSTDKSYLLSLYQRYILTPFKGYRYRERERETLI